MRRFLIKIIILTVLLAFSAGVCFAADEGKTAIDTFFEILMTKGAKLAIDSIISSNSYWKEDDNYALLGKIVTLLDEKVKAEGELAGYELLEIKKHTKDYYEYYYFAKYDRNPCVMRFTFYRPQNNWRFNGMYIMATDDYFERIE